MNGCQQFRCPLSIVDAPLLSLFDPASPPVIGRFWGKVSPHDRAYSRSCQDVWSFYRPSPPVAASPLLMSVPDLRRVGPRPDSGPSNPDPGPIEGDSGDVGEPRSGLRDGTWDAGGGNFGPPGEKAGPTGFGARIFSVTSE
jgi:hypothetical protein